MDSPQQRIRRFFAEVWNGHNYAAAGDLYSDAYTGPFGRGPAAKAAGIRINHTAFPDMRVEIDELVVAGETAAVKFTLRGTDTGGYAGRPPPADASRNGASTSCTSSTTAW